MLRPVASHGYGSYSHGCRCETCRAAKRAYMRARRATANHAVTVVGGVKVVDDPAVTHGARSTYEERGCRCAGCVAAHSAADPRNSGRAVRS